MLRGATGHSEVSWLSARNPHHPEGPPKPTAEKLYQKSIVTLVAFSLYSLHCTSLLGLPHGILNANLVKPKHGTTMETICFKKLYQATLLAAECAVGARLEARRLLGSALPKGERREQTERRRISVQVGWHSAPDPPQSEHPPSAPSHRITRPRLLH